MTVRRICASTLVVGCVLLGLVGCSPTYEVEVTEVTLTVPCGGGTNLSTNWAFPVNTTPVGLVWLQHGFSRSKSALADLTRTYAARGVVVVAPSMGSFGGCGINAAAMHTAVASVVAASTSATGALQTSANAARAKLGKGPLTLPTKVVMSGHSAGGALATVVGGKLASDASATVRNRLSGVVLLDPVENSDNGMAAQLPNLAAKKVYTVSAGDSSCNSNSSGTKALIAARDGFLGVRLPSGCHCDAEADSTDGLCTLVCGTPTAGNKAALKKLAADWVMDLVNGTTTAGAYPGGTYYEQQRTAGTIATING